MNNSMPMKANQRTLQSIPKSEGDFASGLSFAPRVSLLELPHLRPDSNRNDRSWKHHYKRVCHFVHGLEKDHGDERATDASGKRNNPGGISRPRGTKHRYLGSIERATVSASVTVLGQLAQALEVDACELIRATHRR